MTAKPDAHPLDKMREKFAEHQISKLPKETGAQAKQRKAAQDAGNWPKKCEVCGGYHHERAVHLDYVGHAALTDRLLDTDPEWSWEPVAFGPDGLPAFDNNRGMWIRLTIHGVTRLGYGAADGKTGGDAVKEVIGDALRNAAMRFGAALDLWHKGDLHLDDEATADVDKVQPQRPEPRQKLDGPYTSKTALKKAADSFYRDILGCGDQDMLTALLTGPDSQEIKNQLLRDWPGYMNGDGMPPEFEPINALVKRLKGELPAGEEKF